MTKKPIAIFATFGVCLGVSALPAHADAWQDIVQRKTLKCGTFADVPPFAAPDPKTREMVGFDVDMCKTLAKHLGLTAAVTPLSVEARVPEVQMGRVDVTIANLAYTTSRADQIQFSDSYYVAKEMLAVKASNSASSPTELKGKRLSSAKGSTSELSITLNGSEPVTFQDTGSAYMALQQNKSVGMVANTMTITKLVNQSKTAGSELKMLSQPMLLEPVAIGMKKGESVLAEKVNAALMEMDKTGEIDAMWAKWLGLDTEFKMTREEHVQPISAIKFTPIP
ncbi:ABC transporter substrate-binding protein [Acidisphaera sp. L21]|uniref:ABC transporter substrate-binding protein n=1 Tax=Acidisphaera sp. L21 TaxID=1641851 RepID=UPI00131D642E|nr:ABC transporter substrate-binding protein [Acidisphaera sp. L21]